MAGDAVDVAIIADGLVDVVIIMAGIAAAIAAGKRGDGAVRNIGSHQNYRCKRTPSRTTVARVDNPGKLLSSQSWRTSPFSHNSRFNL